MKSRKSFFSPIYHFSKPYLKFVLLFFGIINGLLLVAMGIYFFNKSFFSPRTTGLNEIAAQVLNECKNVKYRPGCYEKKLPLLMDAPTSFNMQQAFEVMSRIQAQDSSYGYCHVTAHYISQKEVRKNPDDWKAVITKCPPGDCSNGCVHGVFMERFNAERLSPEKLNAISSEVRAVCLKNDNWDPTVSESYGCFHALGHTAMYLSDANIDQSLKFCYQVAKMDNNDTSFFYSCYQGVFMQVFQPLDQDDKALVAKIRPNKDTVTQFCSPYTDYPKKACLSESWPLFYPELKKPEQLAPFCASFNEQDKKYCYSTVINILTSNSQLNIDYMLDYCSKLTSPSPGSCLGYVALRLLWINIAHHDQAIDVCKKGEALDSNGECYQALIRSVGSFLKNPQVDKPGFCSKLPSKWQATCWAK